MPSEAGPHDIDSVRFILGPGGVGTTKAVGPRFYEELDAEFDAFRGCALVQRYTFAAAWSTWEMHPSGDEFVYLLEGDTDFVLRRNGGDEILRVDRPGSYVVVPRGIWHTARPHSPTTLLFITPGEGTLNAPEPPSSEG